MPNGRLFRDTAIYAAAPQLSRLLGLLLLPFITPYLSTSDYGIFGLLVAYMGLVDGAKDLGLSLLITNTYFKHPKKYLHAWARIYSFLVAWSVVLAIAVVPVVYWLIPASDRSAATFVPLAIALIVPPVMLSTSNLFAISYLQFQGRPIPIAVVSAASGIVSAALTYLLVVHYRMGYKGLVYPLLASSLFGYAYYQWITRRDLGLRFRLNFSWRWIRKNLAITIPTIPHFYTNYLLTFSDRILLHWHGAPISAIGQYSFAYNLGNNFSVLGKSLGRAAGPIYMRGYKEGDHSRIRRTTFILQTIFLVLGFCLALWLREIFMILVRQPDLASSYTLAIPVVMANAIYPCYFASINLLRFHEQTGIFWKITSTACLVNAGLNLALIPVWGVQACAWTTFVAYLYMGFSAFALKEFRQRNSIEFHALRWVAALVAACGVVWILKDQTVALKLLVTLLACVGGIVMYRKISSEEVSR